jgi:colanic acid/amylovoran biosynthesis glycosyltransferase
VSEASSYLLERRGLPESARLAGAQTRLRIAFFLNEFPALSETFVLGQLTGLIERGHDVTVFAYKARPDPTTHAQVALYDLPRRTRYLRLPGSRLLRVVKACGLAVPNLLRRPRVTLRALNPIRYGRDAASLRLFYWATRLADEEAFDILHCHFGPVGSLGALLLDAGVVRGRLVTTFHGVDVSAYVRDDVDQYRRLFSRGDLFMPISDFWRDRLVRLGCDPARISVHRMGVDLRRFACRPRGTAPGRALRLLTVGRLVEKKGIEFALRAVASLRHGPVPIQYVIVGDGPLRAELEALARALRIDHRVTFHGWQPHDAVENLMYGSDILVAPSVTSVEGDQEGIPVTLMEGMATGMPVVSTYHSGIPELIEDGVSGLLVPERDVDALAAALRRLMGTPDVRSAMGRAAREKVEREYDLDVLNDRLVEQYRRLLEGASPGDA